MDVYLYQPVTERSPALLDGIPSGEAINLRINSPGGDAWAGEAMRARVAGHAGKVTAFIDGLAASAATLPALAADAVEISAGGFFVIHEPHGTFSGDAGILANVVERLNQVADKMAELYAGKMNATTQQQARELMRAETWFDAGQAVAAGFADRVGEGNGVEANLNGFKFKRTPQKLAAKSVAARAQARLRFHHVLRSLRNAKVDH